MEGGSGLFRQQNIEKRKILSVMDWVNMCDRPSLKSPSPNKTVRGARVNSSETRALHHNSDVGGSNPESARPPNLSHSPLDLGSLTLEESAFYGSFDPHSSWLPPDTNPSDYTPEACRNLERNFWRTCGIGTPAWYGADMQGSLFTDTTTTFNVAHLPSLLTRLKLRKPLPGVNTPYLYFGMWRATFAWHVEDMDLYSINYIHWGAPKFWYAVPAERSTAFEGIMRGEYPFPRNTNFYIGHELSGYFPADTSSCPEFLRHKSYLASPTLLAESACRPNVLVQHEGEFVITFPRGYHAGFNLGLNCAESVNFALENWVELGRKAGFCQCVPDRYEYISHIVVIPDL
jgi:JmjC domain, hydroxylase